MRAHIDTNAIDSIDVLFKLFFFVNFKHNNDISKYNEIQRVNKYLYSH